MLNNNRPTRISKTSATIIDHFITDNITTYIAHETFPCDYSDHQFIITVSKAIPKSNNQEVRYDRIRAYSYYDMNSFLYDLNKMNWNTIYCSTDVNVQVSVLTNNIEYCLDLHAPYKTVKHTIKESKNITNKKNPWVDEELRKL